MPNRILRDWTDSDIINRISQIDTELKYMPRAEFGNPLGAVKWSLYSEKRRLNMRLAKMKGNHSFKQAIEMINSAGGICPRCEKENPLSIDHIVPISKGGSNGLDNLQVLCNSCNSGKGNKNA